MDTNNPSVMKVKFAYIAAPNQSNGAVLPPKVPGVLHSFDTGQLNLSNVSMAKDETLILIFEDSRTINTEDTIKHLLTYTTWLDSAFGKVLTEEAQKTDTRIKSVLIYAKRKTNWEANMYLDPDSNSSIVSTGNITASPATIVKLGRAPCEWDSLYEKETILCNDGYYYKRHKYTNACEYRAINSHTLEPNQASYKINRLSCLMLKAAK
jgi:hypothetical protein